MQKFLIEPKPINSLSFWRYIRLRKCFLSGAFPEFIESPYTVPKIRTRVQYVGKIFHLSMEKYFEMTSEGIVSTKKTREEFNKIIASITEEITQEPASAHLGNPRGWPELVLLYEKISKLSNRQVNNEHSSNRMIKLEKMLFSSDGKLSGQPDALFISDELVKIVDYKSGSLQREGELKEEYIEQLYFYSYLVEEKYGKYPNEIMLVGKDLDNVQLKPDPIRSRTIAQDMKETLDKYNKFVNY